MSPNSAPPDFEEFARWVTSKVGALPKQSRAYEALLAAARVARDQSLGSRPSALSSSAAGRDNVEVLLLLAAASTDDDARPPELMTAKGFRVTLAYDDASSAAGSSICVLVQCPLELITQLQGQTAYLCSGRERFELGQFDVDGKAIGTLPAGIEIKLSDFAAGNVKLEAPGSLTDG
jgi:hypothetical protein